MKAASKAYNQTEYFLSKYLVKFKILSALLFAASLANAGAGAGNNWWQRSGGQRKVIRGLRSGDPGARKKKEAQCLKYSIFNVQQQTGVDIICCYWQEVHKTSYIFEDNPFFEFFYFFILFLSQTVSRKVHLESNICCIILI